MKYRTVKIVSIILSAILLFCVVVFHAWIASRLSFWGDETDTLAAPGFRPWRGAYSFWWQLSQYNANPPGEALVLRLYNKSNILDWLKTYNEELFWRLPHIFAYSVACVLSFIGAWRWTGSVLVSFFSFCFMLISPGAFFYATEARFYIWLLMFMTAAIWQWMIVIEAMDDREKFQNEFIALVCILTTGICFHVMILPICILFAIYAAYILLQEFRFEKIKYFCLSLLPLINYQFFVKRRMYFPPADEKMSVFSLFKYDLFHQLHLFLSQNLAWASYWQDFGLYILVLMLFFILLFSFVKREKRFFIQSLVLMVILLCTPLALALSSSLRHYQISHKHLAYLIPVVFCSLILSGKFIVYFFSLSRLSKVWEYRVYHLVSLIVLFILFSYSFGRVSSFAMNMESVSPVKVNYAFTRWRSFYRALPDAKQLVVVGSRPNSASTSSDLGTYNAGMLSWYVKEFKPVFISKAGAYDSDEQLDRGLEKLILAHKRDYDFLVVDSLQEIQGSLPQLPWKELKCHMFGSQRNLFFCRI